mmetsp:Transcript_6227/g.20641  ORF Transcript_6227/g.20641 Transcript_6227/m.20641 type:complete len:219 (+) Transcript_6227:424-1080(+)
MVDRQLLVADLHDHLGHLVHGDLLVRANVERLLVVGHHQPDDALDGVVNVAEGARLLPVAPHLELARRCDALAAKCGGRLFAPSLPRAERAVDVVEAADARLHAKVGVIVHEQLLGHQLLEAVGVLRLRGPRVVLLEPARAVEVLGELLVLRVDAGRGRVPKALDARDTRRLGNVEADHGRVVQDARVVRLDEAHAAHVRREVEDPVHALARGLAVLS